MFRGFKLNKGNDLEHVITTQVSGPGFDFNIYKNFSRLALEKYFYCQRSKLYQCLKDNKPQCPGFVKGKQQDSN